jgi:hypothetical protein
MYMPTARTRWYGGECRYSRFRSRPGRRALARLEDSWRIQHLVDKHQRFIDLYGTPSVEVYLVECQS